MFRNIIVSTTTSINNLTINMYCHIHHKKCGQGSRQGLGSNKYFFAAGNYVLTMLSRWESAKVQSTKYKSRKTFVPDGNYVLTKLSRGQCRVFSQTFSTLQQLSILLFTRMTIRLRGLILKSSAPIDQTQFKKVSHSLFHHLWWCAPTHKCHQKVGQKFLRLRSANKRHKFDQRQLLC